MKATVPLYAVLFVLLTLAPARAVIVETHSFNALNLDVPDGNPSGLTNVQNFSTSIGSITDLEVSLKIIGTPDADPLAFNGDLYVYLSHSSGLSILLNRVGRTPSATFGYSDNGLDITLDDQAANGDVHGYRNVTTPAPGAPLTGIWAPDARAIDPNLVVFTDPRTSLLSSFNTLGASGDWTLFVADLTTGEEQRLVQWSLTITGDLVPEPTCMTLLAFGGVLLAGGRRRGRGCPS